MNLNLNQKNSNAVIHEAAEFFKSQGYSVLNNGFGEVISDPRLCSSYIDALMEGVSADNAAEMQAIMNNSVQHTLMESLAGIAPLSSLSMPVIRKLWPRVVMKHALKTKVAAAPIFTIAYQKPYLSRWVVEDGVEVEKRLELPRQAFTHDESDEHGATFSSQWGNDREIVKTITVSDNAFATEPLIAPAELKKTPLDRSFEVVSATIGGDEYYIGKKLGLEPVVIADVKLKDNSTAQVIVRVNFEKAEAYAAIIGTGGTKVTVKAYKSSEWNEIGWDVNFTIKRQEITIGTGDHLNAPVSVEYLQDVQALYNIDAAAELADLMTNTFAQKVDYEIIDFMIDCYLKRPRNEAYPVADGYKDYESHMYSFDCRPAAGFAGGPTAWRAELKTVINVAATNLMRETYLQSGTFVIVGNPLDTQLLQNIDWQYKGGTSGNVDGVEITYEMGVYQSSTYVYKVISSLNFEPGKLLISFIPSGDKQLCQAYYPYSFTIEKGNGYRSPNHQLVPSIMMTKRHTMHEFMPCTALIAIVNNDGKSWFNPGNLYTNNFAAAATGSTESNG